MKFSGLVMIGCAATAMAGVVERRSAQTVLNDISTVSSQLQTVYNDVQRFQGGPSGTLAALGIQSDSNRVADTLDKAAKDSAALSPLSNSDSAAIALAIAKLEPSIVATLELLISKRKAFENAALGFSAVGIVHGVVQRLKDSTDGFAGNITVKFVPSLQKVAPLVTGQIDYHFVQTLQAF